MGKLIAIFLLCGVYVSAAQAADAASAASEVAASGVAASGVAASEVAASGVAASGVAASGVAASGVAASGVAASGVAAIKPIATLSSARTLFKIRVTQYLSDVSPKFYRLPDVPNSDNALKAPVGTVFNVVKKIEPNYIVEPLDYKDWDADEDTGKAKKEKITSTGKSGGQHCGDDEKNVCINKAYKVEIEDIDSGYGLIRESLVSGMFVAPFKYYPRTHTFSTDALTLAPYFGYETDGSLLTRLCRAVKGYPCGDIGLVQKFTGFIAFGPSIISVAPPAGNATASATNVFALSLAAGVAFDINQQIKFMLAVGKDATGSSATPYKYNAWPWAAATLGYAF